MSNLAAAQAAAWRIRKYNRSRRFTQNCTPWSAGLVVAAGDVCQSFNLAWTAQNSGTTGGTAAPNNSAGPLFTDAGGVAWYHTSLLLVQPPPIA
jgi:hypothetical protein